MAREFQPSPKTSAITQGIVNASVFFYTTATPALTPTQPLHGADVGVELQEQDDVHDGDDEEDALHA